MTACATGSWAGYHLPGYPQEATAARQTATKANGHSSSPLE